MPTITIREVAELAGVSIATVSDVLREKPRFRYRPETVAQVRAAAAHLGYRAHGAARLLRQQPPRLVGITIDVRSFSLNPLVRTVYRELERHNYEPMLLEARQLTPASGHVSFPIPGILAGLLSVDLALERALPAFYDELRRQLPVVALYPVHTHGIDCITTDRALAIEMAMEYLKEQGHRHLAFAQQYTPEVPSLEAKREGWQRGLKKLKLSCSDVHEMHVRPDLSLPQAIAATVASFPTLHPRPTALICGGEEMALGFLSELDKIGWKIPEDISLISFGSSRYSEFARPPLTALEEPYEAIAHTAVMRLLELIEEKDETTLLPRRQLLPPRLIVRQSTQSHN